MIVERDFSPSAAATPNEAEHLARVSLGQDLVMFMNILEEAFEAQRKSGNKILVTQDGSELNNTVQEAGQLLGLVKPDFKIRFKPQEPLGRGKLAVK